MKIEEHEVWLIITSKKMRCAFGVGGCGFEMLRISGFPRVFHTPMLVQHGHVHNTENSLTKNTLIILRLALLLHLPFGELGDCGIPQLFGYLTVCK